MVVQRGLQYDRAMMTRRLGMVALVMAACASCGNSTKPDTAGAGTPAGTWVFDEGETRRMTEEYIDRLPEKERSGAQVGLAFIGAMSRELTLAEDGRFTGTIGVKLDTKKPAIESMVSGSWASADGLVKLTYVDPAPSTMTCDHGKSHLRCKDPQGKATAYMRR